MDTLTFNTGRQYTQEGQSIECTVLEETVCPVMDWPILRVLFNDTSRGVRGIVEVETLDEASIMRAYDNGHYTQA